jgi:hypothetical protein
MSKIISIIGSREAPEEELKKIEQIAGFLREKVIC